MINALETCMTKLRDYLRISEAADYFGFLNTLRNWERAGKILFIAIR